VEQELLILPQHPSSTSFFSWVAQSKVVCRPLLIQSSHVRNSNNGTYIFHLFVDTGRIVDPYCLTFFRWEVIVCFVDTGRIVDHHCLTFFRWEVIVCFVDTGRIVDHHCLAHLEKVKQWWSTIVPVSTKQTITSHLKKVKQWGSTILPISTKQTITSHLEKVKQWFLLILVELLTIIV
jgi:hypothetical protein